MASESIFTGFGDSFIDTIASDLYVGLHLPCDLNFLALEDEALFHDIFGPPLSPHAPPFSTSEYFPASPQEGTSSAPGVAQNLFRSVQTSHETLTLQPRTVVAPSDNIHPATFHDETIGVELQFTGPKPPHSSVLPIFSLSTSSSPLVTTIPPNWIKVPQRNYDHGRRRWTFERSEPIPFNVSGRPGINMGDALRRTTTGLDGRDDPVLQEAAGAISCRLLFPGYPANTSYQIHALGWARKRLPITRSKLAHEVAKKVQRYLTSIANSPLGGSVEDQWKVGEGFMHIDNMFLVRLVSVSKGSFQPEIWVVDPSAPPVLVDW